MNIVCWLWLFPSGALFGFILCRIVDAIFCEDFRGGAAQKSFPISDLAGMTPAAEDVLYNCGFLTLEKIASSKPARLRCILKRKRVEVDENIVNSWPRQAHFLVFGRLKDGQNFCAENEMSHGSPHPGEAKQSALKRHKFALQSIFLKRHWVIIIALILAAIAFFLSKEVFGCKECVRVPCQACAPCQTRPPIPAVEPVSCSPKTVRINEDALFEYDKSDLKPEGGELLMTQLKGATHQSDPKNIKITSIVGHADLFGPPEHNRILSLNRARSIKKILETSGVSSVVGLDPEGRGQSEPLPEIVSICEKYYPKREDATKPGNMENRKSCFQPLRRVDLEVDGVNQ